MYKFLNYNKKQIETVGDASCEELSAAISFAFAVLMNKIILLLL